jgi:hypothetical protein
MASTTQKEAVPVEAASTAHAAANPPVPEAGKKKKRRRSKRLQELGRAESGVAKASSRLASAVARGLAEYVERSDRSARAKKDGALRDLVKNAGKGLGETIRRSAEVPSDLVKALSGKRMRRRLRNLWLLG